MVAPIGKLANKFSFLHTSAKSNTASNFNTSKTIPPSYSNLLPTMSSNPSIGIDIQLGQTPTYNPEVRGRNPLASFHSSREPSLASSG